MITGPHGFVGKNLIRSLCNDNELYGLARQHDAMPGVKDVFTWDDLAKDTLPPVDAIIHLAGKAHDTKNRTEADVYFKVNRDLTQKLYDYYLAHPSIRTFIFFSSVKAAADRVQGDVLTEDVVPTPVGLKETKAISTSCARCFPKACPGRWVLLKTAGRLPR